MCPETFTVISDAGHRQTSKTNPCIVFAIRVTVGMERTSPLRCSATARRNHSVVVSSRSFDHLYSQHASTNGNRSSTVFRSTVSILPCQKRQTKACRCHSTESFGVCLQLHLIERFLHRLVVLVLIIITHYRFFHHKLQTREQLRSSRNIDACSNEKRGRKKTRHSHEVVQTKDREIRFTCVKEVKQYGLRCL